MANTDSFINEVTEEVRKDRLYALLRRWGWLAALIVVAIVGTAAYFEYTRAQDRAAAQAFGDALLAAVELPEPDDRIAALSEITPVTGEGAVILALLTATEEVNADQSEAAAARLRAAAETPDIARRYRDLALLRAEMLVPSDPAQARIILESLAEPGAPYAGLAQEQLAYIALRNGDTEGAVDILRSLENAAQATPGLQQRASQLIVAIEAGSELVDSLPEPVVPDVPAAEEAVEEALDETEGAAPDTDAASPEETTATGETGAASE